LSREAIGLHPIARLTVEKYGMDCIEGGGRLLPCFQAASCAASVKEQALPHTDPVDRSLTVLEKHVQDLLEECRTVIEESKYCIAQSLEIRERSRELVAASQNLRTH